MSLFAILGSGFGLYGYLPAIVSCGHNVLLPERYRERIDLRPELSLFIENIEWAVDESNILDRAEGIVCALQPEAQYNLVLDAVNHKSIKYMLLEKPLAQSPQKAQVLFDRLIGWGKNFRINYIFRYTAWMKELQGIIRADNTIKQFSIEWCFLAHHFYNNISTWKRSHAAGGGIIRFYGIHIIALLAEIGYSKVSFSHVMGETIDECKKWHASFSGLGLPACEIMLDSQSTRHCFQIEYIDKNFKTSVITNLSDPFDKVSCAEFLNGMDPRVPLLMKICHSLEKSDDNEYDMYAAIIKLWMAVENINLFLDENKVQ